MEHFKDLFHEIDVNNDGMISLSELKVGLKLSSLEEAEELFAMIDDNDDRRISYNEFLAFMSDPSAEFFIHYTAPPQQDETDSGE